MADATIPFGAQIDPVAQVSPSVAAMQTSWRIAGDLLNGTVAMRSAGTRYLPKWPQETDEDYRLRLNVSTLFPAYSRTVTTLAAKPFSRPITYDDKIPPQIEEYMDDIDMNGRSMGEFAADQVETALGYGICGIVVDFPVRDAIANTQAAEKAAGLRPYWYKVGPDDMIGWKTQVIDGKQTLTQVRFYECVETESADGFTTAIIRQIRVLDIGSWRVFRYNDTIKHWEEFDAGLTTIDFVPFVPVYGDYCGFMESKPPLIELAYLNVKHWQSQSDQDHLLHFARVPILTVTTNDTEFKLVISGNVGLRLPLDATAQFVEHSGAAIDAGKTSLDDLKDEMRNAGAELLMQRGVAATATEVKNDSSVGNCALQRITQGAQDSLNIALDMTAKWIKLAVGGTVQLYNDFINDTLDDIQMQLLVGLPDDGLLSRETTFTELQRVQNIAPGIKWEDEVKKIKAEGWIAPSQMPKPVLAPTQPAVPAAPAPGPNNQPVKVKKKKTGAPLAK